MAAAGAALFANLGILFAIGVAVGFAKENHGAAGLAGVVCYLISVKGAQALLSVPPSVLAAVPASAADLAVAAFKEKATDGLMGPDRHRVGARGRPVLQPVLDLQTA